MTRFIMSYQYLDIDKANKLAEYKASVEDEIERSMKDIKELPVEERFKVLSMMN